MLVSKKKLALGNYVDGNDGGHFSGFICIDNAKNKASYTNGRYLFEVNEVEPLEDDFPAISGIPEDAHDKNELYLTPSTIKKITRNMPAKSTNYLVRGYILAKVKRGKIYLGATGLENEVVVTQEEKAIEYPDLDSFAEDQFREKATVKVNLQLLEKTVKFLKEQAKLSGYSKDDIQPVFLTITEGSRSPLQMIMPGRDGSKARALVASLVD